MPEWLQVLFIILGPISAVGGLWILIAEVRRVRRARGWPRAMAEILDSRVTVSGDRDEMGEHYLYGVRFSYQYHVDGTSYKGSANDLVSPVQDPEWAEALRNSFPVGTKLPIAYNPERPDQSLVADPRHQKIRLGNVVAATALVGFALLLGAIVFAG